MVKHQSRSGYKMNIFTNKKIIQTIFYLLLICAYGITIAISISTSASSLSSQYIDSTISSSIKSQYYNRVFKWAHKKGAILSPKIQSVQREACDGGTGIFAVNDIRQGEEIIHLRSQDIRFDTDSTLKLLPNSLVRDKLTSLALSGSSDYIMASLVGALSQSHILRENNHDIEDAYGPFLDILSVTSLESHMLFWTTEEIDTLLIGTIAHARAKSMSHASKKLIEYLIPSFMELSNQSNINSDNNHGNGNSSKLVTKEDIITTIATSFACMTSRGFDKGSRMLPIIDLMNHSSHQHNVECFISDDGTARIVAKRDIESGEELLLDYGNRPCWDFATEYGFCPDVVAIDSAGIPLPLFPSFDNSLPLESDDTDTTIMLELVKEAVKIVTGSEPLVLPLIRMVGETSYMHPCVIIRSDTDISQVLPVFEASAFILEAHGNNVQVALTVDTITKVIRNDGVDPNDDNYNNHEIAKLLMKNCIKTRIEELKECDASMATVKIPEVPYKRVMADKLREAERNVLSKFMVSYL